MPHNTKRPLAELTPQGGLEERGIHDLLGYQLAQATIVTDAVFERVVSGPLGLRPVEFTILQLVKENSGVTPSKLAKALAMTAPAITTWLDRMAQRGTLLRERSSTDRRAQSLHVTPEGEQLVSQALALLLQTERALLEGLSEGERQILLELLHKVACARAR
jgi:DNA-binding MarR family transcriptional regulator